MYEKIANDINENLSWKKRQLKEVEKDIIRSKAHLAEMILDKQRIEEQIQQYELLLTDMGIDPTNIEEE